MQWFMLADRYDDGGLKHHIIFSPDCDGLGIRIDFYWVIRSYFGDAVNTDKIFDELP